MTTADPSPVSGPDPKLGQTSQCGMSLDFAEAENGPSVECSGGATDEKSEFSARTTPSAYV